MTKRRTNKNKKTKNIPKKYTNNLSNKDKKKTITEFKKI